MVLTIPKTHVRALNLAEGARIGVSVDEGRLVADPGVRSPTPYKLDDLVAQCDPHAPMTEEEEAWLNDRPVGGELI